MALTPVEELGVEMIAMAVDEEQSPRPLGFVDCFLLKQIGEPLKTNLITCPVIRGTDEEALVLIWMKISKPWLLKLTSNKPVYQSW